MNEVQWLEKVVTDQQQYIDKLLREIEALEDRVGAKQVVAWELQDLREQELLEVM